MRDWRTHFATSNRLSRTGLWSGITFDFPLSETCVRNKDFMKAYQGVDNQGVGIIDFAIEIGLPSTQRTGRIQSAERAKPTCKSWTATIRKSSFSLRADTGDRKEISMPKQLPPRPNLEQLRKQAKSLLKGDRRLIPRL